MTCLGIDTSGNHLTVFIMRDKNVLSVYHENVGLKHSVTLMPVIEDLLEKLNITISDVDVFCTVVGPGSFTGIRIGVSTVKALAYSLGKKVLAVTSFESLAYNTIDKSVVTVIDARHENYYVCGFENGNITIEPCFMGLDDLKKLENIPMISDVKIPVSSTVGDLVGGFISAVKDKIDSASYDIESLIPLYVKKSQAEEERK